MVGRHWGLGPHHHQFPLPHQSSGFGTETLLVNCFIMFTLTATITVTLQLLAHQFLLHLVPDSLIPVGARLILALLMMNTHDNMEYDNHMMIWNMIISRIIMPTRISSSLM